MPHLTELSLIMVAQGGNSNKISQQIKEVFQRSEITKLLAKIITLIKTKLNVSNL